jgi:glutamyl-Q tRNA(Asp) synthetase
MEEKREIITRFAPSPTGRLHIGHAYSALFAYKQSLEHGGRFILRIEDIDTGRCRPEFERAIIEDLKWLGIKWQEPVRRQSGHFGDYREALDKLQKQGVLYPCFCTRKEIIEEISRSASAPHGPEGALYPGTCRSLSEAERNEKISAGMPYALRLNVEKALTLISEPLVWTDIYKGRQSASPEILGDVVLSRKDIPASYHLCVTLDDHIQEISLVTRGEDLFYASHLHRLIQCLLDLDEPLWCHHSLLLDKEGKRFAKRNKSVTLQYLRETEEKTPIDIMDMAGISI